MGPFEMFEVFAVSFALAFATTTIIQVFKWLVSSIENQVAKKWRTTTARILKNERRRNGRDFSGPASEA